MDPYLGEIRLFSFNFAPRNWLQCNGSLLNISQYSALYALLGTIYGGDGVNTFALPDLRGRIPIGKGTGAGLSPRTIGQKTGTETVLLTVSTLPQHNHNILVTSATSTAKNPAGNILGAAPGGLYDPTPDTLRPMEDDMIGSGGSVNPFPHENMPPFMVLNYCISIIGIFPSQN